MRRTVAAVISAIVVVAGAWLARAIARGDITRETVEHGVKVQVARFSRSAFFRRVGPVIMPPLERLTSAVNGGGRPLSGVLVPSLVLHAIGAKSGIERDTPLMYCPDADGRMFITGSNFARGDHPAWTYNLIAHPEASVTVRGRRIDVTAEMVGDSEREAVWATLERQWPGYRGYERTAGRTLRIFRLTPVL